MPLSSTRLNSPSSGADFYQLLSDGRILLLGANASTWTLSPDTSGNYANGTWTRHADAPYTALYGHVAVLNNGRIYAGSGEHGSSAFGQGGPASQVFDPATNTWRGVTFTYVGEKPDLSLEQHSSAVVLDDGRIVGTSAMLAAGVEPGVATQDPPWGINAPSDLAEAQFVPLPDGTAIAFDRHVCRIIRYTPGGYSTQLTGAGSSSAAAGFTAIDTAATVQSLLNQEALAGRNWRIPPTHAHWVTLGPAINYEVGPAFYMPKINKVVLISGIGAIFTCNTDGTGLAIAAWLPMSPQPSSQMDPVTSIGPLFVGNLPADYIRRGVANIITQNGTIPLPIDTPSPEYATGIASVMNSMSPAGGSSDSARKSIWVRANGNTRAVRIDYTTATAVGSRVNITGLGSPATPYPNGASVHPPTTVGGSTASVEIGLGDQVSLGAPFYYCTDSPAAFLPNGDVAFMAGCTNRDNNGGFALKTVMLKWDGTSAPTLLDHDDTANNYAAQSSFAYVMFPLPNGQVFIGASEYFFYTPTTAEAVPLSSSRPTITSIPSTFNRGTEITVSGTTMNGVSEGGMFGDDKSPRTNFPVLRFRNAATNAVRYVGTHSWSYRGIGPNRALTCQASIPTNLPTGNYQVTAIASGVESLTPFAVQVTADGEPLPDLAITLPTFTDSDAFPAATVSSGSNSVALASLQDSDAFPLLVVAPGQPPQAPDFSNDNYFIRIDTGGDIRHDTDGFVRVLTGAPGITPEPPVNRQPDPLPFEYQTDRQRIVFDAPPTAVLDAFDASFVEVVRFVDIYESDGVTPYLTGLGVEDGNITVDGSRDERRVLDMTLVDDRLNYGPDAFWYDKIIKPYRGFAIDDIEYVTCLGEFMIDKIGKPHFPSRIPVSGRDYTKKLMLAKLADTTTFQEWERPENVIRALALNSGIPANKLSLPFTNRTLNSDTTFDRLTPVFEVMKKIANGFGYEIFFDNFGTLVMREFVDPLTAPLSHTFQTGRRGNLVSYDLSAEDTRIKNEIVVYGAGNNNRLIIGRAENNEPTSPTRIAKIGRRTDDFPSQHIATVQDAQALAQRILAVSALESFNASLESIVAPWLEAADAVGFFRPDASADEPNRFLLSSFSIPLSLGTMSAEVKRVTVVG
jgi:hypothetical protein